MFSKMYVLSNTDYRCLINDILNCLEQEEVTKENIAELSQSIWDNFINYNDDIGGFMICNKNGDWVEVWDVKRLEDFIYIEELL